MEDEAGIPPQTKIHTKKPTLLKTNMTIPHLPVPYIFGTNLPVANILGNWTPGSKYIGNWKMREWQKYKHEWRCISYQKHWCFHCHMSFLGGKRISCQKVKFWNSSSDPNQQHDWPNILTRALDQGPFFSGACNPKNTDAAPMYGNIWLNVGE